jgi:signal transduction histidine kinase/phage shock protein PspC (stress-responsive transcriptional regulator)
MRVTIDLDMTATATPSPYGPPSGHQPGHQPGHRPGPPGAARPIRRAVRDTESPILGGVAAGLARHLGLPVLWVRAAFVVTAALHGLGGCLYLGLWLMLPADQGFESSTPGGESATRGGRRPRRIRRLADAGPAIALAALGLGGVLVVEAMLGQGFVLVPIVLGVAGVALLWRQADEAQRERWLDTTGRIDPARVVFGSGGWASYARVAAGVVLVFVSLGFFALRGGSLSMARDLTIAGLLGVVGLVVVIGPWIHRLALDLTAERAERVRTQERADVAAHLHDSVLQTLALIQKNSSDSQAVARLARAQERDLRAWLYAGESTSADTVAAALRAAAAEVEDSHGVAVDVVVVGDRPFSEAARPLVAAAREAIVNAAKHARVQRVDVYAEITGRGVEVFVRDRGVGFAPEAVAADRHGLADSIIDRMTRHGGSADVRSTPGEGTEVRLRLPLEEEDD